MAKYKVSEVTLNPNPVNVNEAVKITVSIIKESYTWDYLKGNFTWDSLKASGETWDSLKE